MEVIGSEQRQEDPAFFKPHWEEETARRRELQEVGTTRQEERKIRLRPSPFSQRGPLTNERRRTATSMQNVLTSKISKIAASEEETARRDSTFHGLTRGRWQPLVRDSKFGQRQQLLQSRGSRRRTIEDEQPLRRRRLLQRLQLLNGQRQRLGGGNRSTEFFVPRTHSTDLEVAIRQDLH